jgi:uncharacterized cupredoxin-like copper-binding protein
MSKKRWVGGALSVAALSMLALPACGGGATAAGASSNNLHIGAKEFSLRAEETTVKAGTVVLHVVNSGTVEHEVVAFKSDLPDGAFPMTADGTRVNEDGAGITHFDPEAENVKPSGTKAVTLNLQPGRYVFICNIAGHYHAGMHTVVNVTA